MKAALGIAVLLAAAPASFASEAAPPQRSSPQQRLGLFASDQLCGGACSDSMVLEHTGGVIWGVGASGGAVVTATVDGHEADNQPKSTDEHHFTGGNEAKTISQDITALILAKIINYK